MKKFLLLCCLFANTSFAATDSLKISPCLQGTYTTGNYTNYSIGLRTEVKYNFNKSNLDFLTIGKLTQTKNDNKFITNEREVYSNLSYSYVKSNSKFIIFSENEYSLLRKINWRGTLGIGYGYKFVNTKETILEISEAIMPENIYYKDTTDYINSLRLSTRVKLIWNKHPLSFSCIGLIQPSIWNSNEVKLDDNIIIRNNASFGVFITKKTQIGITDDYVMNTYIANHFKRKPYDNSLNFYIKMNF